MSSNIWINPTHPEPSELLSTAYNRRLPEWRLQAYNSANKEHWRNRRECVFAMFGVTMGFNNLIYLPSIVMASETFGTFSLQFIITMFLIGFPLLFLQLSVGQFTSFGPYRVAKQVPLAEGVGIALLICNVFTILRLNIVMSWLLFYFFSAFHFKTDPYLQWLTPWSYCSMDNTTIIEQVECGILKNTTQIIESDLYCYYSFLLKDVLRIPLECSLSNPHFVIDGTHFNWALAGCIIFIWAVGYLHIYRGIRSIGKVIVFLVPITILLFIVFIIVGLSANYQGSTTGIKHYVTFSWESLYDLKSWYRALDHVANTLNLGNGTMIVIGAYAHFQSPAHYDAFYICVANVLFTFLAAILVFCFIGMSADKFSVTVNEFMDNRANFAIFVLFPIVVDEVFLFPPIWVFLTFGTLFMMISTAMYTNMIVFLKPLYEITPWFKNNKPKRTVAVVVIVCLAAIIWLFISHNGSLYFLFATKRELAIDGKWFILICFSAAFIYGFGMERLRINIEFMLYFLPNKFFCGVWYALPFFFTATLIYFLVVVDETVAAGNSRNSLIAVRWVIFLVNVLPIPIMALWNIYWFHKDGKLKRILRPREDVDSVIELPPPVDDPNSQEPSSAPTTSTSGGIKRTLAASWLGPSSPFMSWRTSAKRNVTM